MEGPVEPQRTALEARQFRCQTCKFHLPTRTPGRKPACGYLIEDGDSHLRIEKILGHITESLVCAAKSCQSFLCVHLAVVLQDQLHTVEQDLIGHLHE